MKTIVIAKDFTATPEGGKRKEGPFSGEAFREDYLIPALFSQPGKVMVDLSHTTELDPSFLDEAFGGLVRIGISKTVLKERLELKGGLPLVESQIWKHIEEND